MRTDVAWRVGGEGGVIISHSCGFVKCLAVLDSAGLLACGGDTGANTHRGVGKVRWGFCHSRSSEMFCQAA